MSEKRSRFGKIEKRDRFSLFLCHAERNTVETLDATSLHKIM
ncbi:MAG: hypothetical protein SAJ37_21330 [Oscillatoria sp. PMC 1068.18]|nr:hypothetical protein [Oscillatoria sp. PMC 1076.18]MEC4991285.1 hypothetical protein [Oscillatoria sp. PMC 1068.18]